MFTIESDLSPLFDPTIIWHEKTAFFPGRGFRCSWFNIQIAPESVSFTEKNSKP